MPDSEQQRADTETQPASEAITTTNLEAAKEWLKEFDNYQVFRLQTASNLYQKVTELANSGTALYEKLILLDGATIALSITFLGYLSSRIATDHLTEKPHLWMVAVAWSLLIISIYFCYLVIVHRHSAMLRLLGKVSRAHTEYMHQRLSLVLTVLSKLVKGKVSVGSERADVSVFLESLSVDAKQEGEKQIKTIEEATKLGEKSYVEGPFARIAIWSTILAVSFLCAFTIRSLHILF